jgi:hypothetical protein
LLRASAGADCVPAGRGKQWLWWKFFTFDEAAGRATNVYAWETREAAEAFFSDDVRQLVTELYGVEPRVSIVDIVQVVNNSASAASQGADVSLG